MKILHNPSTGAPIQDVWYKNVKYLDAERNETFRPGMILSFEDDNVADFIRELYEFVLEIDPVEAKKYLENQAKGLKCDKCEFRTDTAIALSGHKRSHEPVEKIENLGIPMVKKNQGTIESSQKNIQDQIDREGQKDGLEGEGLINESFKSNVVMR